MGYSFSYHSPMVPLFNGAIGRAKASGIIDRLMDKHSPYRSMRQQVLIIILVIKYSIYSGFATQCRYPGHQVMTTE